MDESLASESLDVVLDINVTPMEWPTLPAASGLLTCVTGIPDGTVKGRPAVGLRIELVERDGAHSWVFGQASWACLYTAVMKLKGRYGEPDVGDLDVQHPR